MPRARREKKTTGITICTRSIRPRLQPLNKVRNEVVTSVVDPAQNRYVTNMTTADGNLLTTTETGLLGNGSAYSYTSTYTYDTNGNIHT